MILPLNQFICGDTLKVMQSFPSDSINLIVTSPPYNIGKAYDGFADDLPVESYWAWLREVCHEMYRVIKPNANVFINICDIGISNEKAAGQHKIGNRGNFYVLPHHTKVIDAFIEVGAQYLHPIFWRKPSNCTSQYGGPARFCGTYPYPRNCHVPSELEYILHFRKNGLYEKADKKLKEQSKLTKERWLEISSQLWEFNGRICKAHPATFPLELPKRCIQGWSMVGDIVLDPFMGIGTTAEACEQLRRNFIGIDQSQSYCDHAFETLSLKRAA